MEAPHELQIDTVSHNTVNANADRPKPTCHHCKKPGLYKNQYQLLKKQREQTESNQTNPGNKISDATTSNPSSKVNNQNNNEKKNKSRADRKPKTVYPPCPVRHMARQTIPQRNAITEPMQPIDRLPAEKTGETKSGPGKSQSK